MTDSKRLWAVIPGISGGTGGACARALADRPGLNIFGMHRGTFPDQAEEVQRDVEATGVICHIRNTAAATPEEITHAAAELLEVAGPRSVKVFIHAIANASYGTFAANTEAMLHPKQVEKTFTVMAHSFVYWIQELRRRDLLAEEASLIALTNPMAESVVQGWGLIAAAKAALRIYVRQIAAELGPQGHRVAVLKFGLVETHAIRIAFSEAQWEAVKQRISSLTPHRRLATVDEVGRFVSTMVGEGGEWFSGAEIDFSGGQTNGLLDPFFNDKAYPEIYNGGRE